MNATARTTPQTAATVDAVKTAHQAVLEARKQHKRLAHKRNSATFVLVLGHQRKVQPTLRRAGIGRHNWAELLPKAPVPSKLQNWSAEEAERIIDAMVKEIAAAATEETEAREARIRGLRELAALTDETGARLYTNAAIARMVGMSEALVGEDLGRSDEPGDTVPDEPGDTAGLVPIAELADALGVQVKKVLDLVEYARENGIDVPRMSLGGARVVLVDVSAFQEWWTANRFHWLSAQELAERWGVPYPQLKERLRTAKAKGEAPQAESRGRRIFYEPAAADEWAAQRGYAPADR